MSGPELQIASYSPDDADQVRALFRDYPYKRAQKSIQKLDADRLNDLYFAGLTRAHESNQPVWSVKKDDRLAAAAGLAPDPWHSEIYGIKMGKIQPWLNYLEPFAGDTLLSEIMTRAKSDGYEHLSVRIDAEEFVEAQRFERAGFNLIDVSLKFSVPMPLVANPPLSEKSDSDFVVRLSEPADAEWMKALGARAHAQTHFLNDPHLPREKTKELFAKWVERCIDRLAYRIYVLTRSNGERLGFVIYLRNQGMQKSVGVYPIILDYVILDPAARGGGIGPWFIAQSLRAEAESGFDFCELRTSVHNHSAIGCYEKLGFRLCASDFVFHRKL